MHSRLGKEASSLNLSKSNIEESLNESIKYSDGNLNKIETTIHKALKLIRKNNPSFDKRFGIYVDKKIPYNSGLGGGSSDAGAVIRYLCDSYDLEGRFS